MGTSGGEGGYLMIQTASAAKEPRIGDVIPLLWERLGPNRLMYIFALLLCLGQTLSHILVPIGVSIYYQKLEQGEYGYIQALVLVCTAVTFFLLGLNMLGVYLKLVAMTRLNRDVTLRLADEAQRLPLERAQGSHSSDLVQRVTSDSSRTTGLLTLVLDDMGNLFIVILCASVYMMWLQWQVALLILMIAPVIIVLSHSLGYRLQRIGYEVAEQEAVVRQYQQETLQGIETIRAYGIEEWMTESFVGERARLNKMYMKRMWWQQWISVVTSAISNMMVIVMLLVVGWLAVNGSMPIGSLMVFFMLISQMIQPMQALVGVLGQINGGLGGAVRMMALERAEKEPTKIRLPDSDLTTGNPGLWLTDTRFSYRNMRHWMSLTQSWVLKG
ncbi:ABC transporter ATP-binding protein [Cohnella faecalis]|uniref:ABC transporter ATP-binding protein n=2 Tax=Cohnella faecalis TaxID=2315694 RepID=A0A398CQZ2_9BACL|nr:ABC transporter ATP-binding protein [Cohnella faecalis]